jgi:Protein of unknown function (DUF3987)
LPKLVCLCARRNSTRTYQRVAREAADDGLLQRFLYCVPTRQGSGVDRSPDYDAIRQYEALFPALSEEGPYGHQKAVRLHPGAQCHRRALDELVIALKTLPDTTARMKAALDKLTGIYPRLCLIFHLIEYAANPTACPVDMVPETTAKRAARYVRDILLPHLGRAEAIMYRTAQTGHARWIAGFILVRRFERIPRREIMRAYGLLRAPECACELTSVMDGLAAMGWAREEKPENPARAPAAWQVNPKVHAIFAVHAEQERRRRKEAQEATADIIRRSCMARENVANVSSRA